MKACEQNMKLKKRPSLTGRVVLIINLALAFVLGSFVVWNSYVEWNTHIAEKRTALEEEAKILTTSVVRLKTQGNHLVQNFIDEVCGAMQETTSPGHHIAVQLDSEVFQAKAHHRASPAIFSAMKNATSTPDGLAGIGDATIVVGTSRQGDVTIYVSEYLSNIKHIIQAQIIRKALSILVVGLALAMVLNVILRKLVAVPLRKMVTTVQQFGEGERSSRMPSINTKELGVLADEFNYMAGMIEKAEKERSQRLEKARMIQQNLLPDVSSLNNIKLACLFHPAAEVAGDYYDIVRLADNTLLLCVADVIGHDVPAAMSAAMLKAILKTAVEEESSPQELIHIVHVAFSRVTLEGDFATMILVHLDFQNNLVNYASAGHETGYLVRYQGQIEKLNSTGPILGIHSLTEWSERKLTIRHGDRLIMLTDGIAETLSLNGEAFGSKRVVEIFEQNRLETLDLLSEKLLNSIKSFRGPGPQLDDITMLAIEL